MPTDSVELVETCFALLYRSELEVYKLRRPVELWLGAERVDLSSSEARRLACLAEERMNRRLAPGVALETVPVKFGPDSRPDFGSSRCAPESGRSVEREESADAHDQPAAHNQADDWALRMRRLPDSHRADHRLANGTLTAQHLHSVAARLATFHERARGEIRVDGDQMRDSLRGLIEQRIAGPRGAAEAPLPAAVEGIEAWQLGFLDDNAERFERRARSDAIREGHGELALEHVFVNDDGGVQILAGLEMGPRTRRGDVAADISLLAADLAVRHRVDLAEGFVAEYARLANDFDFYPLLDFYSSLRATLRGKLDSYCAERVRADAKLSEAYRDRAQRFFALARSVRRRAVLPPVVVAMGGQVASGKSTVARHIAQRIAAPVVSSDATRDFLLGARLNADLHEVSWEDAYEQGFGARVYDEVLRRAGEVLASGRPVVIDGCFRSPAQRARARALASRLGYPFLFVEATISRPVQLERLAGRAERDAVPLETWTEIADRLRAEWIPAREISEDEQLRLDTSLPLEHNAIAIEERLPTWPEEFTG